MSDLPPPRSPDAKWHGNRPDPAFKVKTSKRGQNVFWLTALLLALLGATLAVVFYPNSMEAPKFLRMTVREYQSPLLPRNAWTVQDGRLLAERFKAKDEDKGGNYDKQSKEQFDKFLAQLETWKDGPLVVYLCALARKYGPNDEVVLFLGDSDPDRMSNVVPLKKVLDAMSKGTGDRLLLLDLARPVADVRLGVLSDDLAATVHEELERANPPFFVLTSCSPGQMSNVSEELGASAFAYYLDLGLSGFAEHSPDRRITVVELAEFVKKRVDRWAWVNRGGRQEPRLYGVGVCKDFPLVQLSGDTLAYPDGPKEKTYPPWLKAAWKERDATYRDGSYRRAPGDFRHLETELALAEKKWRTGWDDDEKNSRIEPALASALAKSKDAIAKARDGAGPRPLSLAQVRNAKSDAIVKDFQVKLDHYLNRVLEPGAKIDDSDKARVEELKKFKAQLVEELKKLPPEAGPDAAAAALVAAALRPPNLTPGRIVAVVELLGEVRQDPLTVRRFAETVYLDRLKDLAPIVLESADWRGAVAHLALEAEKQSQDVLAELGKTPSGFAWNQALLVQGETHRAQGDKDLFTSIDFTWRDAETAYKSAIQAYNRIPQRLEILRALEENRDQAFVHLPGWGPYLIAAERVDPQEDAAWKGGLVAAGGLANLLEANDPVVLESEPTALIQWRGQANQWQKMIDSRLKRLKIAGLEGKADELHQWRSLLESSRLSADEREAIWTAGHKLALKLIQSTPPPDATDAEVAQLGIVPGDDPTARQEDDRKRRRVEIALALLDLVSYPGLASLETDPKEGDAKDAKPLARRLQEAFVQGVPKQFLGYAKSKDKLADAYAKADRVSRIFPDELLKRSGADANNPFRNPALALHRLNRDAFWSFLRDRYQREMKDFRAIPEERRRDSGADVFYAEAADAFAGVGP